MVYITMSTTSWFDLYFFYILLQPFLWYVAYAANKTSVVRPLQQLDGSALKNVHFFFGELSNDLLYFKMETGYSP